MFRFKQISEWSGGYDYCHDVPLVRCVLDIVLTLVLPQTLPSGKGGKTRNVKADEGSNEREMWFERGRM